MKTYMPNPDKLERKWYVVDASGLVLGRLASEVAKILRGKNKPEFTPHADTGDYVVIVNADKIKVTGRKLDQKIYYRHTGYVGGLKAVKYKTLMAERPELAVELAVKGMVPDNTIGRSALTRQRVYRGAEHDHAAQQPETVVF